MQGIEHRLIACIGMYGGHETMHEADTLVEYLRDRSQAVCGAGRVGNDRMILRQLVMVDAVNDGQVDIGAGGGNENLFRACLQMLGGGVALGEDACAFEGDIDTEVAPGQVGRVAFRGHLDRTAAEVDGVAVNRYSAGIAAMHAVILQKMGVGFDRTQVIDADNFDVRTARFINRPQDISSNPSKSVNCYTNSHFLLLLITGVP